MASINKYKKEIEELYSIGHTNYAIALKVKEWFDIKVTEKQIEQLLNKPPHISKVTAKLNKQKDIK